MKTDLVIRAPNDEAHSGIMQKLSAQDILFDTITSFGLGDIVKAKAPGEEIFFEVREW